MPKADRPNREQARHVLDLLRSARTDPDVWTGPERAAVSVFHRWAYGAPMTARPTVTAPRLPSQLLGDVSFVLTAEALDRLPVLTRDPGDGEDDRIDGRPLPGPAPSDGYLADAEQWTPGDDETPPPEVLALMRLDRILGNEHSLSEVGTGRARGIVLGALNSWHGRQRNTPVEAPGEPVHTGEPVDEQVGRLADWIMENNPGEPSRPEGAVDCAIRLLVAARRDRAEWDARSAEGRRQVERLVAANRDLTQQLADAVAPDGYEANLDALRAEIARLSAHLASSNDARDANRADAEERGRLLDAEHARRLEVEAALRDCRDTEERPVDEDPRRPHLDHYPSDALLLTYREVRRLLALHLEACSGEPHLAAAMLDGESPLRLSEVLT